MKFKTQNNSYVWQFCWLLQQEIISQQRTAQRCCTCCCTQQMSDYDLKSVSPTRSSSSNMQRLRWLMWKPWIRRSVCQILCTICCHELYYFLAQNSPWWALEVYKMKYLTITELQRVSSPESEMADKQLPMVTKHRWIVELHKSSI